MGAGGLTLRGGRVVRPGGVVGEDVHVRDGRLGFGWTPGAEVVELDGRWLLPGFVDLHVHGGDGAQANTSESGEIRRLARFHARHGTTALLATTVAAPVERLLEAQAAIGMVSAAPGAGEAAVLGVHLEGPFLSPARPGAIDPRHLLAPDLAVARRLLDGGGVRLMTLAPELPGALAVVAAMRSAGVVVSLGHSEAGYADVVAAVAAGARSVTHTFNAMGPLHQREPGLPGAALDLPELTCELICDGHHLHPAVVRLVARAKGAARTLLVTDAIAAAGLEDGSHLLGDQQVEVRDGRVTLPGTDTLAGSTLTMDRALRGVVALGAASVEEAARMAATTPAELLGIADRRGAITPGRDADLVILEEDLTLAGVIARGEWVRRDAALRT